MPDCSPTIVKILTFSEPVIGAARAAKALLSFKISQQSPDQLHEMLSELHDSNAASGRPFKAF